MFSLDQFFTWEVLLFLIGMFGVSFLRQFKWNVVIEFFLNLGLCYHLFFQNQALGIYPLGFLLSVSIIVYFFSKLSRFRFIAFIIPAMILILSQVLPRVEMGDLALYFGGLAPAAVAKTGLMSTVALIGLSYLVFRWYRFLLDQPSNPASFFSFFSFLLYCFYMPIFYIGPITGFKEFSASIQNEYKRTARVFAVAILRLLWGAVKFYPLASIFYQLTFSRLLLNPNPQLNLIQFILAAGAYPAYLFLNFSGFIDLVIGLSAILGIHIDKNFDRPYLATSVRDFWRRWHISLTDLLKDLIHIPCIKLLEKWGFRSVLVKYVVAITLVFLVMGYWHGGTSSFYIFSLLQIAALIIQRSLRQNREETSSVKKTWLKRFALWVFLAVSFFFFENSPQQIQMILQKTHF